MKKALLLTAFIGLLLLLSRPAHAQLEQGCITLGLGGALQNANGGAIQTSDGGFAISGIRLSSNTGGDMDIFLARLDANGTLLWVKKIGTAPHWDWSVDMVETGDGGFVMAGMTEANETRELLLTKVNAGGEFQWAHAYGDGGLTTQFNLNFHGLAMMSDGGFALSAYEDDGFGPRIVRTDAQGELLWSWYRSMNQSNGDVAGMPNGDLVVVSGSPVYDDAFVARLNGNGQVVWKGEYYIGDGTILARGVAVRASDSLIVVGGSYSSSPGNFFGHPGTIDLFAMGLAPNGTGLWATAVGTGDGGQYGSEVVIAPDNGCVVAGYGNLSDVDPYIVRLNNTGQLVWARSYPYPGMPQYIYQVDVAADDGYLFTGLGNVPQNIRAWKVDADGNSCPYCPAEDLGTATYTTSIGSYSDLPGVEIDNWAIAAPITLTVTDITSEAVYDVCGTIGFEDHAASSKVAVWPNPFVTSTSITLAAEFLTDDARIVVTDALGREVRNEPIRTSPFLLQRDGMAEGSYPYRILANGTTLSSGKLMVFDAR